MGLSNSSAKASFDRWLTTNPAAERGEEIEQAIDEYLEKMGYHSEMCPSCLRGVLLVTLSGYIECSCCDDSWVGQIPNALEKARNTAFKRIMEERGE